MANKKSNTLFQLIQSLNKSEKRFFKLYAQKIGKQKEYKFLKLFTLIEKQKTTYDESLILSHAKEFKSSQMSNMKAHLYKLILDSLNLNKASKLPDMVIREMINHAHLLFNRSLYKQCAVTLKKAKKLAIKHAHLTLQLEILIWEKKLLSYDIGLNILPKVNNIIADIDTINQQINNVNLLSNIATKLDALSAKIGFVRDKKDFDKITNFINASMPDFSGQELSFEEKSNLYHLETTYYLLIQDFNSALKIAEKWTTLFEEQSFMILSHTDTYIKAVNSLLIIQSKLLMYQEFVDNREKLQSIRAIPKIKLNENIQVKLFKYYYVHDFNLNFMLGNFTAGVKKIERIRKELETYIYYLDNQSKVIMYYKIACLYFGSSDYKGALDWLNRIINKQGIDIRQDIQSFARILALISHFELGNNELVDYFIKSTYRYMFSKKDWHEYQRLILEFLRKLNRSITKKELTTAFENLKNNLLPLRKKPYEKRAFMYFDIISWLESKIHNIPIEGIIQSKAQQKIFNKKDELSKLNLEESLTY